MPGRRQGPWIALAVWGWAAAVARPDTVEYLNERVLEGTIVQRTATSVTLRAASGAGTAAIVVPAAAIHAVVQGGQRMVLNSRPAPATIEALIQKAGATPPDWWNTVPLDYPATLDLSWPVPKPKSPWDPSRNVGQYIWSVINENPGKWRSGARFLHHLLTVNKDNPAALERTVTGLANVYQNLLQDWPRAAFWRRKAVQLSDDPEGQRVRLAECYWRLGSKAMALAELKAIGGYVSTGLIKLRAEMGDVDVALVEADDLAEEDRPEAAWMAAGDACRLNARYDQAVKYYERVLNGTTHDKWTERARERAQANIAAIKAFNMLDLARVPDGTWTASSISYTGPLEVAVEVRQGRIISVRVTKHTDKQYYAALTETPRRIVERQGVTGIDAVTSATITCDAIVNATARALQAAMQAAPR